MVKRSKSRVLTAPVPAAAAAVVTLVLILSRPDNKRPGQRAPPSAVCLEQPAVRASSLRPLGPALSLSLVLLAAVTLAVMLAVVAASAAKLTVNGGTLQVFTLPADIEVPPPPLTNLEAEYHHSLPTVDLTWEELADGVNYNVYRGTTAGGPYEPIGGSETESYVDTDILEGQTYYYVVTAVGANGLESQPSNEAEVLIAVATPTTTNAPQATPTAEPTPVPTPELTLEPTPTSTPDATATPTPEPTAGPEPSPDPTSTPEPTPTPDATATPESTATAEPTATPEPTPTPTPTP